MFSVFSALPNDNVLPFPGNEQPGSVLGRLHDKLSGRGYMVLGGSAAIAAAYFAWKKYGKKDGTGVTAATVKDVAKAQAKAKAKADKADVMRAKLMTLIAEAKAAADEAERLTAIQAQQNKDKIAPSEPGTGTNG